MRCQPGVVPAVMLAAYLTLSLEAQVRAIQRPFYAEQRDEVWYPDGKRDEDIVRITRLANRSFLAIYPLPADNDRFVKIGYFFYLNDTQAHVQYVGDTALHVAWPNYDLPPSIPGQDSMVDRYGDCSVLTDDAITKVAAGKIRHFAILRIDQVKGTELYSSWIAPELGCFPLRRQVLVDGLVRERVETVQLDLLPEDTQLSLPKGIRTISPQAYCDLYRKRHGQDYLPQRECSRLQEVYDRFKAANGQGDAGQPAGSGRKQE
jgi:hypothetical protein